MYYHKINIERDGSGSGKEIVMVKCITSGLLYNPLKNDSLDHYHLASLKSGKVQHLQQHPLSKRDVLPAGFQEPE